MSSWKVVSSCYMLLIFSDLQALELHKGWSIFGTEHQPELFSMLVAFTHFTEL